MVHVPFKREVDIIFQKQFLQKYDQNLDQTQKVNQVDN